MNINNIHWCKDIDKLLDDVKDEYHFMEQEVEDIRKTLSEWNKDEEIQKLKKVNRDLREHSLLQLSDAEMKAEKAFRDKHYNDCALPLKSKAKGNTYIYTLTGTGLGTIIEIQCPICGERKDITDIDSW